MLDYLSGTLVEKSPAQVVLDRGGMGFSLQVTLSTFSIIQHHTETKLYTHLHVRNEGQNVAGFELYGFATQGERSLFRLLLSVSGVGASTARMALSSLSPEELIRALQTEDETAIKKIKGIGPKSAKRLILELKDKVGQSGAAGLENIPQFAGNSQKQEALSALVALGFQQKAAQKALDSLENRNPQPASVEDWIKESLKTL